MKYAIDMTLHARRQLEKFGVEESDRIVAAIRKLADDPRPPGAQECPAVLHGVFAWGNFG